MALDDEQITGEVHKGIVFGLPVLVVEDEVKGIWVAPANWFVGLFLVPYMASWFYSDDSLVFIHEGSYWDGLMEWLFTGPEGL